MRLKLVLVLALALVLAASQAMAQTKTTVFTATAHNTTAGGNGCKNCHIVHQATAKGEVLLWNQSFPTTASFGFYASDTMDNAATEVGGNYSATNLPTGAKMYSVLCLSCHDGITAISIIAATSTKAVANPTNSDGLKNDHPVNMGYNTPTVDPGLETTPAAGIVLFNDTVQCASCHNAHDNTIVPFLRIANSNAKAGLCGACHK